MTSFSSCACHKCIDAYFLCLHLSEVRKFVNTFMLNSFKDNANLVKSFICYCLCTYFHLHVSCLNVTSANSSCRISYIV